jgi:hypothetical protein
MPQIDEIQAEYLNTTPARHQFTPSSQPIQPMRPIDQCLFKIKEVNLDLDKMGSKFITHSFKPKRPFVLELDQSYGLETDPSKSKYTK